MADEQNNVVSMKPGTVTPASLLKSYMDNQAQLETVIVIAVDKDGYVNCGWSRQNSVNLAHSLMCGYETIKQQGVMGAGE